MIEALETLGKILGTIAGIGVSIAAIFGMIFGVYRWYLKQNKQDDDIKKIKEDDIKRIKEDDIKSIKDELCLLTYGVLACLKGLAEQGCDGPVTDATDKIEKHLNKQAHK